MSPIQKDGAQSELDSDITHVEYDEGDAADAFADLWSNDAEKPSEDTKEAKEDKKQDKPADTEKNDETDEAEDDAEDSEETPEDEGDEDGDEEGDEDDESEDPDDKVIVKHVVDGEEKEFTLGQLKRLAGQEASLGRKSQEVASARKAVDTQAATQVAQLNILLDRAKARFAPFEKIDFLAAAKNPDITQEELAAARNLASSAYEEVAFLTEQTQQFTEALQNERRKELREKAVEAIKVLSDPKTGIEGWNAQLYGEIRSFAVSQGLDESLVNEIVDPSALKMINMARLYAKGLSTVQKSKPEKKAPKRIVKGAATEVETKKVNKKGKTDAAMNRLRSSGSVDDASDAFASRWSSQDQ